MLSQFLCFNPDIICKYTLQILKHWLICAQSIIVQRVIPKTLTMSKSKLYHTKNGSDDELSSNDSNDKQNDTKSGKTIKTILIKEKFIAKNDLLK